MRSVRVKICGITRPADAVAAEAAGADAIGLMFVAESPRVIGTALAREISDALGPLLTRVGVFRDAPIEQVLESAAELRLGAVQLHGSEPVEYVERVSLDVPVIRAVSFRGQTRAQLESEPGDALLVDGLRPGSGKAFDWAAAAGMSGMPRLILAGGLTPDNVGEGVRMLRPYGVDVSSGVEQEPGVKDQRLMAAFVARAREASAERVA